MRKNSVAEIGTFINSSGPLSQVIFHPPIHPGTPPLYYIIEHFTLQLGNQEAVLRLPSLIFGLISIALFYLILSNWFDKRISIVGTIIITISPFHVWYSQEARPYSLLLCLSLLSIWLFQRLIKNKSNIWLSLAFVISTAWTFYCHTVGISLILFIVF